jgi:hypothetical protein
MVGFQKKNPHGCAMSELNKQNLFTKTWPFKRVPIVSSINWMVGASQVPLFNEMNEDQPLDEKASRFWVLGN